METEQERAFRLEREPPFKGFGGESPNTYLGKNFCGFANVELYKIARQARTDAFDDIREKGFAAAYATAHPHAKDQWSTKFHLSQMHEYLTNYRQAVLGYFMAMGEGSCA